MVSAWFQGHAANAGRGARGTHSKSQGGERQRGMQQTTNVLANADTHDRTLKYSLYNLWHLLLNYFLQACNRSIQCSDFCTLSAKCHGSAGNCKKTAAAKIFANAKNKYCYWRKTWGPTTGYAYFDGSWCCAADNRRGDGLNPLVFVKLVLQ